MRHPTDKCLLCLVNDAIKTNSHIFPRFISTDFLGNPRRGHEVGGKPKTIQDSPKENYILCESCESYLAVIEGIGANPFKFWKEKVISNEFQRPQISRGIDVITFNSVSPGIIRLLIYSMFWRTSISSHSIFDGYVLQKSFEEKLRAILLDYKCSNRGDLQAKVAANEPEVFPITILTSDNFSNDTANLLAAIGTANP